MDYRIAVTTVEGIYTPSTGSFVNFKKNAKVMINKVVLRYIEA